MIYVYCVQYIYFICHKSLKKLLVLLNTSGITHDNCRLLQMTKVWATTFYFIFFLIIILRLGFLENIKCQYFSFFSTRTIP